MSQQRWGVSDPARGRMTDPRPVYGVAHAPLFVAHFVRNCVSKSVVKAQTHSPTWSAGTRG